jgi:hypothetical protein
MILPFPKLYLYAGAVLAVLLAVGIVYKRGVDSGKGQQKVESDASWSKAAEEQRQRDEAIHDGLVAKADSAKDKALEVALGALQRAEANARTLESLAKQRNESNQAVSRIEDSALHQYIVDSLKLRAPDDRTLSFTFREERELARIVTDYPLAQKTVETLGQQATELKNQSSALREAVAASERRVEAEVQYNAKLLGYYSQLYNAFPRRKRSWKCMGLWRCGSEKKLSFPLPQDLPKQAIPSSSY